MELVLIEREGDQPVSDWIARKLKDFIYEQAGLEVRIEVNPVPVCVSERASAGAVSPRAGR